MKKHKYSHLNQIHHQNQICQMVGGIFNIVTRTKCLCCVICTTLQEERAKYRPNQINLNMTNSVFVVSPLVQKLKLLLNWHIYASLSLSHRDIYWNLCSQKWSCKYDKLFNSKIVLVYTSLQCDSLKFCTEICHKSCVSNL